MQYLDNATIGQLNASGNSAIEIDMLNVNTSRQIYCLSQRNAIAHIYSLKQSVVAEIQLCQIAIGVSCGCIAQLNRQQLDRL